MKTSKLTPPVSAEMTPTLSLLSKSRDLLFANWELVLYLLLLPALVWTLGFILIGPLSHVHHISDFTSRQKLGLVTLLIGSLWSLINLGPSVYFRVKTKTDSAPSLGECYQNGLDYTLRLLGLYIVTAVIVIGGLLLFFLPGVIFFRRYYLADYYLVDKNMTIMDALHTASHDTKPVSGYVWGVIAVDVAFSLLASSLENVPIAGVLLGSTISYVTLFLPILRYREIIAATPTPKFSSKLASSKKQ